MILDDFCSVKVNSKNSKYYNSKGYDTSEKEIIIKTSDLIPGSHNLVRVSCDICGLEKNIIWREYYRSYSNGNLYCCSSKCSQIKNKKTNLERFGVCSPSKLDYIKDKIKKTNLEKYGVENPTKNAEVYNKVKKTISEKYGDYTMFKTDYFRNNKSNYTRNFNNKDFFNNRKHELKLIGIELDSISINGNYLIKCEQGHTYETDNDVLYRRINIYHTHPCTVCNPIKNGISSSEKDLLDFIRSIYDGGDILENSRDIISPSELDIFLKNEKIAIEFNGIYWHSEEYKKKDYHLSKYLKCKSKGIRLIQIWEDDWRDKKDIVKSLISNKLNKATNRIYARKCVIKEVDSRTSSKFLNENHIQGTCKSLVKLGLFYEDELVSIMTFSKNRFGIGNGKNWELTRFCNKRFFSVIGGASKLFNYFKLNYNFTEIISFADLDISDGDLYYKLNFKFVYQVKPTYFYILNLKREHRFKWRKQNLKKLGLILDHETEEECMRRLGYQRVYNSGHLKFVFKSEAVKKLTI